MVETLKRKAPDLIANHKMLDIAYLVGITVGLTQLNYVIGKIYEGNDGLSVWMLAVLMTSLAISASLAYYWHMRDNVFKEIVSAVLVGLGLLACTTGSVIRTIVGADESIVLVGMGGAFIGISIQLLLELIDRVYRIEKVYKQIQRSKQEREKAARHPNPKIIEDAAAEISRRHKER